MSALEEDEAVLFVATATALVRHPKSFLRILSKVVPLAITDQLPFTSLTNLLRLLLSYTSAVSTPIGDIATIAGELTESASLNTLDEQDLLTDVEDVLNWIMNEYNIVLHEPLGAIVQTARDLVVELAVKAKKLGFTPSDSDSPTDILLSFVKAKTLELSLYYNDVQTFHPLFLLLQGDEKFSSWYNGVVAPYHYFWLNFASLDESEETTDHFLAMKSYWDQFDILIAPLDNQELFFTDKLTPERYLTNVILPFAVYHDNNLQSLTTWMFNKHPPRKPLHEFQLWDKCIRITLNFVDYRGHQFPDSAYSELIRNYLAACIYFGLYRQEEVTPLEQSKIYDQILASANSMIAILKIGNVDPVQMTEGIDFDNLPKFDMFSDFVKDPTNPFSFLFSSSVPQCLVTLQHYIRICSELFPVSQLTIKDYWKLKSSQTVDFSARQRAVSQILTQLDETNYQKSLIL
ncbi:CIC11C00000005790 [Sungouiella intermedia]|uniref:CIC11C00000005790 n=1 Tax=Sungouiella intermedia TaxID=45354 RepID=A0A1L0CYE4_9ASCO|nr:CIC11C00000005790 [[Candida] intermedia]